MSQPTIQDVHVDRPLSNLSIAYMQEDTDFIASRVFPVVPVNNRSDTYYQYKRDAFFRSDARERAPGTESAGTGFEIDATGNYFARIYSVHDDIADEDRANTDQPLDLDRDSTELVAGQLLLKTEIHWVNNYFGPSIWTTNLSGTAGAPDSTHVKFWDTAGSTPIEDVMTLSLTVKRLTGKRPNTLVLGPYVANALLNNPEIVDRVKYTELGFLNVELLAQAFGVQRILVPEAINNVAAEKANLDMEFVYGKHALLCYSEPNPGIRKASAGYTFAWKGYLDGSTSSQIRRFRIEPKRVDRIEGDIAFDHKVVSPDMAVFFQGVVQ